jgi:hypothetical protein
MPAPQAPSDREFVTAQPTPDAVLDAIATEQRGPLPLHRRNLFGGWNL